MKNTNTTLSYPQQKLYRAFEAGKRASFDGEVASIGNTTVNLRSLFALLRKGLIRWHSKDCYFTLAPKRNPSSKVLCKSVKELEAAAKGLSSRAFEQLLFEVSLNVKVRYLTAIQRREVLQRLALKDRSEGDGLYIASEKAKKAFAMTGSAFAERVVVPLPQPLIDSTRRQQLAIIHIYKSKLGLSDESYRDGLERSTGYRSAKWLDPALREAAILHFSKH